MGESKFEDRHYGAMDGMFSNIGTATNVTINQMEAVNRAINWGLNTVEVGFFGSSREGKGLGALSQMERQELIRLANINKVDLTVHSPLADPAGATNNGRAFSEIARQHSVDEIKSAIDLAANVARDQKRDVPIVIHSSLEATGNPQPDTIFKFVDKRDGEVHAVGEVKAPRAFLDQFKSRIPEFDYSNPKNNLKKDPENEYNYLLPPEKFMKYKNIEEEQKMRRELAEIQHNIRLIISRKEGTMDEKEKESYTLQAESFQVREQMINDELERIKKLRDKDPKNTSPFFVDSETYAKEKTTETVVELAKYIHGLKQEKKPFVAVENIYPENALSNPVELAKMINASRDKFVKDMVDSKKMKEADARKEAERLIGMTLDVGHLNQWRRYKDANGKPYSTDTLVNWATNKEVKGVLKHVHLTDNWGDEDSHLPIGFGNAPIEAIIKKYKEQDKKAFEKIKMVLETPGGFGFKGQSVGIPYSMYKLAPALGYQMTAQTQWTGAEEGYFAPSESGTFVNKYQPLPQYNMELYGTGFSGLPYSLGGESHGGGGKSRFSGSPLS